MILGRRGPHQIMMTPKELGELMHLSRAAPRVDPADLPAPEDDAILEPGLRKSVGHLRSFRYTVRHATQLAWLHAVSREDTARSTALARFMLNAGFVPGRDLRAAIFGQGRDAPRDFSYRHEPFLDAYGDCRLEPPATARAYPYRSKACLADVQPYLLAARHDTLLPTIEALQPVINAGLRSLSLLRLLLHRRSPSSATSSGSGVSAATRKSSIRSCSWGSSGSCSWASYSVS